MEKIAIILTVAPILMAVIVLIEKLISHTDTEIMWKAVKEVPVTYTTHDKDLTIFDEYQKQLTAQTAKENEEQNQLLLRLACISLIFRR